MNCIATRYVKKEPLTGHSHCDSCNHILHAGDLIPVISWILAKGNCRYCGKPVSVRYPISEVLCAFFFELIFIRFGISYQMFVYLGLFSSFFVIILTDAEIYEIPDTCLITAFLLWAVMAFLDNDYENISAAAVISVYVFLLSQIMKLVLKKDCLGFGDVKLIFLIGLYLGTDKTVWCLMFACIAGMAMMFAKKRKVIPFGPALCLSCMVILLA